MTDQWVPGPPPVPTPPIAGLPAANSWNSVPGCSAPPDAPSIVASIVITNVPATILSPYAWRITLNDGSSPPNFTIDRLDSSGNLIDSPIDISGVDGSVAFADPVYLSQDPVEPMEAATKEYVDAEIAAIGGIPEAPGDGQLYGRQSEAWAVIPEPTVPEAPNDGQLYGRQSQAWTVVPPSPISVDAPNDGQAYVRQSQVWSPLSTQLTGYMPIAGGTFTGPVTFSAPNSVLVGGAAGTPRAVLGLSGSTARWQMLLGDVTAESGGNAGSNFALNAISDTGSLLSTPLAINRALGTVTIAGIAANSPALVVTKPPSGTSTLAGITTGGATRWQMYLADYGAELGSNLGSNFRITSYTDAGAVLASPLVIARQTGVATFSALPSFPGGAAGNLLSTNGSGTLSWTAAPDLSTYMPLTGGLFIGAVGFNVGATFAGPANISIGGGTNGQVLTTNGTGTLSWTTPTGGGGGIADAPNDGTAYARKSAAWAHLTHTDITDWTATLAPYALTTAIPVASTTTPLMNGTAAVGTGTTWARADHVHPTDTSLLPRAGVTDGSNAAAGQIGEVISALQTTGVALATGVASNLVAITLTPGDWDVSGEVWITVGTGCTVVSGAIGTVSGTPPGAPNVGAARNQMTTSGSFAGTPVLPLKTSRFSVSVSTAVYLMAVATFTGGTTNATGAILARRAR